MKKKIHIGTINMNELFMKRQGKLNPVQNPELKSKVHKSKKDYSRSREKRVRVEDYE